VTRETVETQPPTQGVPAAVEEKANASVERFQKLCRDAKRRAIGR
jgi:hypothetical protein